MDECKPLAEGRATAAAAVSLKATAALADSRALCSTLGASLSTVLGRGLHSSMF